jgi:biotin synthase-related radical SAM superfamily protein
MKDEGNVSITTVKKAELIHEGKIFVSNEIELPYPLSSSTAGPGAGKKALAITFGKTRLKLGVSRDENSKFSLKKNNNNFEILKDGEVFISEVDIIPTLLHAPNQAFVNLHDGCIYNCEFCATPVLEGTNKKNKTPDQAVNMILEAGKSNDFQSVAITSGVFGSPEDTVDEIIEAVKKVKSSLPEVEIGVEPYVTREEDIERLHEAGATEIKINIETFDKKIFEKICPELDYDNILKLLEYSVKVFGKGKVATNILIGLGEEDENVLMGVEFFARMGAVVGIRVLRINDQNYHRIVKALGHEVEKAEPERMVRLAIAQKEILEKYGLSTYSFETMCHKCGCCDIVPFKDV